MDLVDIRSVLVGRFAHVDARVLGVRVENVECHETKIVHRPESMTCMYSRLTVRIASLRKQEAQLSPRDRAMRRVS